MTKDSELTLSPQVTAELLLQKRRVSCDTALLEMRDQRNANLIRYKMMIFKLC